MNRDKQEEDAVRGRVSSLRENAHNGARRRRFLEATEGRRRALCAPWRRYSCFGLLVLVVVLGGFVAWQVYRWGRPVPQLFHAAGANRWQDSSGRVSEAMDDDGDGVYDRFRLGGGSFSRPAATTPGARLLAICLDGIPFSLMDELWRQEHFREFFPPVEAVSTFPSESEVAMTALLHAAPAPGYENRYFDRHLGKITGGIDVTLGQSAPYLKKLDYDEPAPFKGIHYILPRKSYRADLGRLRKRFLAAPAPVYVAHISSTDGLCHIYPPAEIRALLLEAESIVRDLYLGAEGKLRVVLFSDHGNNLARSRPAPLRQSLERAGFRVKNALDEPRAVAIPDFGLVSFAAVYTQATETRELARVLATTEGVEVVVYKDGPVVRVHSIDGQAIVEASPDGSRFRYRPEFGDPLRLRPVWEHLQQAGKLDADSFVADADLFAASASAPFPDALFRVWEWAREPNPHVENRADLMVSLADGYYSGSGLFARFVTLAGTHGGLGRGSTLGFVMSTDGRYARPQRIHEVLPGAGARRD